MEQESLQQASKKNTKKILLVVGLLLIFVATLIWLGFKWHSQVNEYKENIVLRDQQIDELQRHIDALEGKGAVVNEGSEAANTLYLKDWGVEILLGKEPPVYTLVFDNGYYYLNSPLIGCWSEGKDLQQSTDAAVGAIGRYKGNEKIPSGGVMGDESWTGKTWAEFYANQADGGYNSAVTIGDYIYNFNGPQQGCGNPDTELGREANSKQTQRTKEFLGFFKNLRSVSSQE